MKKKLVIGYTNSRKPIALDVKEVATSGTVILAMRGGGKSWLNAVIAEGLCEAKIPFVIVDPEGEYWTLKVSYPRVVVAGGEHSDIPLSQEIARDLANLLVEERLELVLDMSDMRRDQQVSFLADFLDELFAKETKKRIPLWVSFEEADIWVPQIGNPRCKEKVLDICQRGRKRGLGFSLVSQRPAILDKTALSQAGYRFFKRFQQPQDLDAVRDHLGPYAKLVSKLPSLRDEEALFYAPMSAAEPLLITVASRKSPHGGATPEQIAQIKPTTKIIGLRKKIEKLLKAKKEEMNIIEKLKRENEILREELKRKEEELRKMIEAFDIAKIIAPSLVEGLSKKIFERAEKMRNQAEINLTNLSPIIEPVRVYGIDIRSGRVIGDEKADFLLNNLTPIQRRVYLILQRTDTPLSVAEISLRAGISLSKTREILKSFKKRRIIRQMKGYRGRKMYKLLR